MLCSGCDGVYEASRWAFRDLDLGIVRTRADEEGVGGGMEATKPVEKEAGAGAEGAN